MDPRDDRRIDEAIDRAVREMMSVDPPAEMRARVLARLDGGRRQTGGPLFARFAVATGVLAAAVLVFVLAGRAPDQPAPDPAVSVATSEPPGAAPIPPEPAPARVPTPAPDRPGGAVRDRPRVARSATARTPDGDDGPAADRPARLNQEIVAANIPAGVETGPSPIDLIPDIDVGQVATTAIEIAPVSVPPLQPLRHLQVEPLESTGGEK